MNSGTKPYHASERGEGKLKAIIYTMILIAGVYIAFKLVPVYVAEYQLKDKMSEQARFAVVNRYTEDQIKDILYKAVQDLDIPGEREDIKVTNTGHGLSISVVYTVPVDLLVYKTTSLFAVERRHRHNEIACTCRRIVRNAQHFSPSTSHQPVDASQ